MLITHICLINGLPEAYNFIKKETLAQVFSCEFCKILNNNFLTEHIQETASVIAVNNHYLEKQLARITLTSFSHKVNKYNKPTAVPLDNK